MEVHGQFIRILLDGRHGQDIPEQVLVQAVHQGIPFRHQRRQFRIVFIVGLQGFPQHADRFPCHDVHRRLHRFDGRHVLLGKFALHHLRDIVRIIGNSFDFGGNLERGHQKTQIARHRLLGRNAHDAAVVDLPIHFVDFLFQCAGLGRQLLIIGDQRLGGQFYRFNRLLSHVHGQPLDAGQFFRIHFSFHSCHPFFSDYPSP